MKKILLYSLLALISLCSCSNDDTPTPAPTIENKTFTLPIKELRYYDSENNLEATYNYSNKVLDETANINYDVSKHRFTINLTENSAHYYQDIEYKDGKLFSSITSEGVLNESEISAYKEYYEIKNFNNKVLYMRIEIILKQ